MSSEIFLRLAAAPIGRENGPHRRDCDPFRRQYPYDFAYVFLIMLPVYLRRMTSHLAWHVVCLRAF